MSEPVRPETARSYRERIQRVLLEIQRDLDGVLSLDRLAELAGLSRFHFHRIFRGLVGETLAQHIRRLRLERAAFRLMRTHESVTSIALDAGYEAHESFTRAFRSAFGCAPSDFRSAHRPPWHAAAATAVHWSPDGPSPGELLEPTTPLDVAIVRLAPRRSVFLRHVGPYLECMPTWERLLVWAEGHELPIEGHLAGICHDDPAITSPEKLRYDACLLVDDDVVPEEELSAQTLFGGRFARCRHEGGYEGLDGLYQELMGAWLPASGRQVRDLPCVELYTRGPAQVEDPGAFLTDVHLPLASDVGVDLDP